MNTVVSNEPRIQDVRITSDEIIAHLADGRVISVPLAWSWRLSDATPAQRAKWRLIGDGQGVHWPEIDEDLSVEGMLHGVPAHRPKSKEMKHHKARHRVAAIKPSQLAPKSSIHPRKTNANKRMR
jgi:hypothetical protein